MKTNCFSGFRKIRVPQCNGHDRAFLLHSGRHLLCLEGLGANGLTALNLAIPIYSFISGSGLMIGMGGGTKYSIQKSQADHEAANRTFTSALYLAAAFAVFFHACGPFLFRHDCHPVRRG